LLFASYSISFFYKKAQLLVGLFQCFPLEGGSDYFSCFLAKHDEEVKKVFQAIKAAPKGRILERLCQLLLELLENHKKPLTGLQF
jgi:hypothetical protein